MVSGDSFIRSLRRDSLFESLDHRKYKKIPSAFASDIASTPLDEDQDGQVGVGVYSWWIVKLEEEEEVWCVWRVCCG